ncbi:MAG: protein kinase, partial [Pseudomonadota bacterium]
MAGHESNDPTAAGQSRTSLIYESTSTSVSRGSWQGQAAVFKALRPEARTPSAISRYQREYDVLRALISPYVCEALDFDDTQWRIILADYQGTSLRDYIALHSPSRSERLHIALQLAEAVQSIHDEGVTHRDLNPANILIIPPREDGEVDVKLIDFGLASLNRFEAANADVTTLTGTLPYISPEQTGRVNRTIDARTDLYSLGATLFELFSQRPPFQHTDPLELIHAHIAATPPLLHEVDASLPKWLSDVVHKLLAKQPEQRYQSAASVADDLRKGISEQNVAPFPLGRTDRAEQLVVPDKLYGREMAQDLLLDHLERCKQGEVLFAHLEGAIGMGKAALADDISRSANTIGTLVASVDCATLEFLDTDTLWIEALRPLLRQILSWPNETSERTLQKIERASSPHLTALIPFLPELEPLVDAMADPGLPSAGIHELLTAIGPNPLCITIANADLIPVECVSAFMLTAVEHRRIMTMFLWEHLPHDAFTDPRLDTKSSTVGLKLLTTAHLRDLSADLLRASDAKVRELAQELHVKTDGVPALVHQLIHELHSQGDIYFDRQSEQWAWDIQAIRKHFFNSNSTQRVLDLLKELPTASRPALC